MNADPSRHPEPAVPLVILSGAKDLTDLQRRPGRCFAALNMTYEVLGITVMLPAATIARTRAAMMPEETPDE